MNHVTEEKIGTSPRLKTVCIQGLGFVGLAMGVAIASARNASGNPLYRVIGVDLPVGEGKKRIEAINKGILPFENNDHKLAEKFKLAQSQGLLKATSDIEAYTEAEITLVSINLDIKDITTNPHVDLTGFKSAISILGEKMPAESLVIVETTVPPGTCEKIVLPIIHESVRRRGLPSGSIKVAHSYERVMPGDQYLDSIINYWRVFAGEDEEASIKCVEFLSSVINTKDYPLTRLKTMTSSEIGKVLENSYRAVNIAFIEEWGRFAEAVGVDLFDVVSAIRKRPTHSNMRQPGFGVGGYCLTKDPLFAKIAAKEIFQLSGFEFPFCEKAIQINNRMPLVTLDKIREHFKGALRDKRILLLGVSYRQDIGDTRYSPSQIFAEKMIAEGAVVVACDPLLDYWEEMRIPVQKEVPSFKGFDAVVFTVQHKEFRELDVLEKAKGSSPFIFDANAVLHTDRLLELKAKGFHVGSIGRGNV